MNTSVETCRISADFYDLYVGKFDSDFEFYTSYCNKSDRIIKDPFDSQAAGGKCSGFTTGGIG